MRLQGVRGRKASLLETKHETCRKISGAHSLLVPVWDSMVTVPATLRLLLAACVHWEGMLPLHSHSEILFYLYERFFSPDCSALDNSHIISALGFQS